MLVGMPAAAFSNSAIPATSLGSQICSGTTAFVYIVWANGSSIAGGQCYDGGEGSISIPSQYQGDIVDVVDNQSSQRIWLAGDTSRYGSFNYCYDKGYAFTLGPPVDGGTGEDDLIPNSVSEGDSSPCTGVPSGSVGTSQPYGTVPYTPRNCNSGDIEGGHVFLATSASDGSGGTSYNFTCLNDSETTYNGDWGPGDFMSIANGTGHAVTVSGPGFSTCVDNNHVIDPVSSNYRGSVSTLTVTSGSGTC